MSRREIYDVEIAMQAFRMMRDGGYRKAEKLFEDLQTDFPEIPPDRLKMVMGKLCRRLMENE